MASKRAGVPITTAVCVSALSVTAVSISAVRAVTMAAMSIATMVITTMPIPPVMRVVSVMPMMPFVAVAVVRVMSMPVTMMPIMAVIWVTVIRITKAGGKAPVRPAISRRNVIRLLIAVIIAWLGVGHGRVFVHRSRLRIGRWRLIYRLLLVHDRRLRILRGHRSVSRLDGSVHQFTAAIDPRDDQFIRHFVLVQKQKIFRGGDVGRANSCDVSLDDRRIDAGGFQFHNFQCARGSNRLIVRARLRGYSILGRRCGGSVRLRDRADRPDR